MTRSALHRLAVGLSLAMVLAGSPAAGQDQPLAAETLLDQCVSESLNAREACAAFVLKSVDRNRPAPEPAYCLPASAILGDLRARFLAWGETRRGRLDMPADDGLAAALAEAFPCPLTQSG
ncbi:MAG: Rap1a/Tai family immunity protein [Proteobacteria bacterium]|nr:Rap1a/Tai family immunity protein [Pseudomonadota bacterium]MDA1059329.1 Rap1a/Tai family immunity protein [Pseudomonadota bacterium]